MTNKSPRRSPRDRTREDIYLLIRSSRQATRPNLVETTGLSSSTVSHAVARLLSEGRIAESEPETKGPGSGSGRPATILTALPTGAPTVGMEFGAGHVAVIVGDGLGNPIGEETVTFDAPAAPGPAIDAAVSMLKTLQTRHGLAGVGTVVAGIAGPVDRFTGKVCSPSVLSGWVGLTPQEELRKRIPGADLHVFNDAVLGAFGELRHGAGREHENFVYVLCSQGIGAAIVVNGQIYHGAAGLAGEIGHYRLPGRADLCRCGNRGCLEAVLNTDTVREQIAHTQPHLGPEQIDLAGTDDPVTRRIIGEAGRTLGKALAEVCNLLNPTALILGGELGTSGEALVAGVRSSIQRFAQPATTTAIEVCSAELGKRAELVGSLSMAADLAVSPGSRASRA